MPKTKPRKAASAKPRRRHSNSHRASGATKPRKRANPQAPARRRRPRVMNAAPVRRRRRRNPNILSGGVNMLKQGLYALVGLVLTRQIPQMILQTNNTGWMGYAANVATAFAVGFAGHKALGQDAGNSMMLGGGLYVANRIIGDYFSPVQQYLSLSGMGDPMAMGSGARGRGMRGIVPGYFPLPVPTDAQNNPIIPAEIRALPAPTPSAVATTASGGAPVSASVGAGHGRMSGVGSPSGRFGGRY